MYGRASVSQSYGNPVQPGVSLLSLWVMPAKKKPKWTIMCLQSRRVKRPQMEIGIGG